MKRILVTPRSLTRAPDPAVEVLRDDGYELVYAPAGQTPDEDTLLRLLPGCVGWIAGVEPVSPRVLEAAAPGLRAISRNGTGSDNLPLDTADRLGIRVLRAGGANARGVAELALTLLLASLRHVPEQDRALRAGNWHRRQGLEIAGRTLGLVGCGAVGRLVARFALAMDARVRVFDPLPDPNFRPDGDFGFVSLPELLHGSEMISLHCPMPADGRPVLDAGAIAALRDKAQLVNTARAGLVDEQALLAALERERVLTYATDVFDAEPPPSSALLTHPRVINTPHVGGFTAESVRRATVAAVDNLRAALDGEIEGR
ncbi:phosphoglycerate dehydrogenase [Rhizosaccharibacter radicis]|uniref:Phosphoglycerate dehydrogenase n=1 Tax=Rhizosaccharibacter radicis TaxID=2782605 RepID=A0ABT1W0X8_9PROT|nr:phosphoglycerate dehydrogenase [Acetobacteraceae bacterium KSS12]